MTVRRVHLVRHGEVENPSGVVYGRMPGFHLSSRGQRQAASAAASLAERGADVRVVLSSPLERTVESAQPISDAFGLRTETDDDFLEATNRLEGKDYDVSLSILARPAAWRYLVNPLRPSWGEAYTDVRERMVRGVHRAAARPESGEIVIVSHQLPIWVLSRLGTGKPLYHDPRKRECAHSSITTFDVDGDRIALVHYADPGSEVT